MSNKGLSRRNLLKGGLVAGGVVGAASFADLFGYSDVFAQGDGDDIATIVNLAATAETFACTHYYGVLTESTIALTPVEVSTLKGFLDAELQHLEFLNANGGESLVSEFYVPENIFNDREQFSMITETAEFAFIGAYLAAVRRIAELGNPLLATVAAQVAAVEQEHLALIRQIGGRRPNNLSLGRAAFFNTSDVVPVLQPFLEGAENFSGPLAFPGADAIRDIIRDEGVIPVTPATASSAFSGLGNTDAIDGEGDATEMAESCTVAPAGNFNVNIRESASIGSAVLSLLAFDANINVDGQTVGPDGFTWWRVADGGWVRSDVVSTMGECGTLPSV
ncbi:MAG: hypothetical protein Phog2KO_37410 [Phototrophicaceae bacterium]